MSFAVHVIARKSCLLVLLSLLCGIAFAAEKDPLQSALSAEFAASDGKESDAAAQFLASAKQEKRADYAERAARLALFAREFALAEQAAEFWLTLAPDNFDAQQAQAFAEVVQGKPEAASHIQAILLSQPEKGVGAVMGILNAPDAQEKAQQVLEKLQSESALLALPPDRGLIPIALRLKQNALALKLAQAASKAQPNSSKAWLWRGLAEVGSEQKSDAARSYEKALALDPSNNQLRLSYVQILNDLDRQSEIEAVLKQAPKQTESIFRARVAFASAGNDAEALSRLQSELKQNKTLSADLRTVIAAQLYELRKKPVNALKQYRKIPNTSSHWPDAQLRQAVLLAGRDAKKPQLNKAREVLQAMQQANIKSEAKINGYLLESELLLEQGEIATAQQVLGLALNIFPDEINVLYARAMAALRGKDITMMEADFRRILALEPDNANAWNALGYSLLTETKGREEEAMGYIERAYTLEPRNGAIVDSLGWGFFKLGQLDQAIVHLREAYKLEPEGEIAAHLAEALIALGADEEAEKIAADALQRFPKSAPLLQTIERLKIRVAVEAKDAARGHEHRQ
jgi:tetratricopeptide (TPR) repeat protein